MIDLQGYTRQNVSYWTVRAPSYSGVTREELDSGQRRVWRQTLDERIQAHFPGKIRPEIRVLDVGTGPGFFAILLTELGYPTTAVDYTDAMLRQARKNAGDLAPGIRFLQMDAQALAFPAASFDVIVSRNLTWNLPQPELAYRQWARVLSPGGLLLNFDANWYRYLYDGQAETEHQADRENVHASGVADDTDGTDVAAMETIARQSPLSRSMRLQWDCKVLEALGLRVSADTNIWQQVWTRTEWINNASTPMFLVSAVKPATC